MTAEHQQLLGIMRQKPYSLDGRTGKTWRLGASCGCTTTWAYLHWALFQREGNNRFRDQNRSLNLTYLFKAKVE